MQSRPRLLIGLPHDLANTLPRILERHHEEVRPLVVPGLPERERALAVIDLRLFARQKLQDIEALRLAVPERRDKSFDRVVAVSEPVGVHQILIQAHRVAPQLDLSLDPYAVRLARRWGDRGPRRRRDRGDIRLVTRVVTRWPGWGSLRGEAARVGGRGGGVWNESHRPGVAADGLPIHARAALDLSVGRAAAKQRLDHDAAVRFQDVHSWWLPEKVGEECTSCRAAPRIRRGY